MDWKSLIADLQARGFTQPQIAEACGCGQATVSDLASGNTKEPRYSLGEALRRLHEGSTPKRTPTNHPGQRVGDKPAKAQARA